MELMPFFIGLKIRQNLKLIDTKSFSSDVVQLCYYSIDQYEAT